MLDDEHLVTYVCFSRDDLAKFKYMTMFLKEMMRLYPPVPVISRWLTKPMVIDGVEIPENFPVDIMIHLMNRHPDTWEDPEVSDIFIEHVVFVF